MISVRTEEETDHGWRYVVDVERSGATESHTVSLSWVDHEHWCGGRQPPSRVIERLMNLLIGHGRPIPATFDAATARRWFPGIDRELAGAL
jgi:hypothetical protein